MEGYVAQACIYIKSQSTQAVFYVYEANSIPISLDGSFRVSGCLRKASCYPATGDTYRNSCPTYTCSYSNINTYYHPANSNAVTNSANQPGYYG